MVLAFLYVFSSLNIKQMLIISLVITAAVSTISALADWIVADIITEDMDNFIKENKGYHDREHRYRTGK